MKELLELLPQDKLKELHTLLTAHSRASSREVASASFLTFARTVYDGFIVGKHHRIIGEAFERVANGELKRVVINLPPRHALEINEKILTTSGWKTIGTLQVGDFVFGSDGRPTRVLGKSEVFRGRKLYRATTTDGASILCDGEHLWTVRNRTQDLPKRYRTLSTDDLMRFGCRRGPYLPRFLPLDAGPKDLPVPPYVLGAWLGDGASANGTMAAHPNDAPHIRKMFEDAGVPTTNTSCTMTFGTRGLMVRLRKLGVLNDKHIPDAYLLASPEQRLALLQGLIDTDGDVARCGKVTFSNSNRRLIEQVCFLVRSFGLRARVTSRQPRDFGTSKCLPAYRVMFKMAGAASLPRKAERCRDHQNYRARRISFEECGTGDTQCISVDREDGLFLAGEGLILTHNTKSVLSSYLLPAWLLGRNPRLQIIQANHNVELATRFGRMVRDLVDTPVYRQIFPGTVLREDSKSAGRWLTDKGGEYFAAGVGSAITGRGADVLIIDDPHALEIHTPIPTPRGFVPVMDLKVGDEVFGPDGLPTKVVAKSRIWHDRELYSATTSDGEEILCDGAHLWGINSDTFLSKARVDVYAASYLADWPLKNRPILPRHNAVEYPERDLPVDPWVLGAWLGNGTTGSGRITASPQDAPYIEEQFRAAGYELGPVTSDGFARTVHGLHRQLLALGVLGNKHVPEIYLTASVAQRLALLQGLMDTDGMVTRSGQCVFFNTNRGLVDAVKELLHSLGVEAIVRTYVDARGRWGSAKPLHRVCFRLQDAARMPRKRVFTRTPQDKRSRSLVVEPTGRTGSVQCITVARPDGLFLAGRGYVVTHNSEQDALSSTAFDNTYEWYTSGPRQRLQPGGAIILLMTRWGVRDLTGRLLRAARDPKADQWEVISLPAILPSGQPLWPEFWDLKSLLQVKASLPGHKWAAQWQQNPTSEESVIIKRSWWRNWPKKDVPNLKFILQSYDTAMSSKESANYSAITTWGVFEPEERGGDQIILLDAVKGRWDFPDLKKEAIKQNRIWKPDMALIEAKASGTPLASELSRAGIPVATYAPGRGRDKITRMNLVAPLFEAGRVWAPLDEAFAKAVVDEVSSFPAGEFDDFCDTVSLALHRFRQGGLVTLPSDMNDPDAEEEAEERRRRRRRGQEYY